MKIDVFELVGENCITGEDGQKLFSRILPELRAGKPVVLDFAKTKVYASPFFNPAIGQLVKDFSPSELNRLLTISNLSAVGLGVVRRVIENAKDYYGNPEVAKALDAILAEKSEAE